MLEQTCIPGIGLIHFWVLGTMVNQSGHYNWHCCCYVSFVVLLYVPFIRSMLASAAAKR